MARWRIGQERLSIGCEPVRRSTSLDEVLMLLDWTEVDRLLAGISSWCRGEPGWPPLALFRALLLATWHDLSEVRLADSLDDRASFRRFCGFTAHEATPAHGRSDAGRKLVGSRLDGCAAEVVIRRDRPFQLREHAKCLTT